MSESESYSIEHNRALFNFVSTGSRRIRDSCYDALVNELRTFTSTNHLQLEPELGGDH